MGTKFDIGENVWYRGSVCEVKDRFSQKDGYALACGKKDVKGELEDGFVPEKEIANHTGEKIKFWDENGNGK